MNFRLLVAFAGGALLATAAFYLVSRTPGGEAPATVQASPAVAPAAPLEPPPATLAAPPPPPAPAPATKRRIAKAKTAKRFVPQAVTVAAAPEAAPDVIAAAAPELTVEIAAPDLVAVGSLNEQVETPPEPRVVTIPEKTAITIRLGEPLASDRNVAGDAFFGSLADPLVVDGWVIAERGARVIGRVTDAEAAGRVKGIATLTLELASVTASDGQRIPLRTARFVRQGDTSKKDDVVKAGVWTAIGAAIGAAAGGGKGAAIGAASGAATGASVVALTRGKAAVLEPETRISFQLERSVTVTERR